MYYCLFASVKGCFCVHMVTVQTDIIITSYFISVSIIISTLLQLNFYVDLRA